MKKIYLGLVLLTILFISFCEAEKPDFLVREDYSYLKKQNNTLLVLRVLVNTDDSLRYSIPEKAINDTINNNTELFKTRYYKNFIKELKKYDKNNKINISNNKNNSKDDYKYLQYINKSYPQNLGDKFDLILEIDTFILLYYGYSHYVHVIKRERVRLIDAKKKKVYLSSFVNETLNSIGEKITLRRNKNKLINTIQNIINRNTLQVIKYILNTEPNPSKDAITPLLPSLEKDEINKE